MQLVGSELDLRQVSWGRRVEIIPGRLSTDGAEEAPHPSSARTPLPGEDRCIEATGRLSARDPLSSFALLLPPHPPLKASTAPPPVDDQRKVSGDLSLSAPVPPSWGVGVTLCAGRPRFLQGGWGEDKLSSS